VPNEKIIIHIKVFKSAFVFSTHIPDSNDSDIAIIFIGISHSKIKIDEGTNLWARKAITENIRREIIPR
jgi:hypothetical protein